MTKSCGQQLKPALRTVPKRKSQLTEKNSLRIFFNISVSSHSDTLISAVYSVCCFLRTVKAVHGAF